MSNIGNQVSELCDSILIFEKHTNKLKQQLFMHPQVCDTLIWNYIIGGSIDQVHKQNIKNFLERINLKTHQKPLDLLLYEYSTKKLKYLTRDEFLFIFIDYNRKGIFQIMQVRKKKFSYANNHQPHYKVAQILTQILIKTLQFLQAKQKMKQNIYAVNKQPNFILEKVNSNQQKPFYYSFLIFINQYQPLWGIQQCEIVLNHILKLRKQQLKEFYYFFVPFQCKSKKINPDQNILKKFYSLELKETYSSIIDHKKASHFGNKDINLKKTLYLK